MIGLWWSRSQCWSQEHWNDLELGLGDRQEGNVCGLLLAVPPWLLRPSVPKLIGSVPGTEEDRGYRPRGATPGDSSSPCPHPSERVTLDFTFLPEFPELGQSPAQSLVPSQWLAEFPGGRKSSLDYLLTISLGFLPL